jgi:hypothetical protein
MEKIDEFTFRNHAVRIWFLCLFVVALLVAVFFPPAFWLGAPGALFLVVGNLANSYRTDQWMSWEYEGSLDWFEGWAVSSGAMLIAVPLLVVLARSIVSK